MNNFYQHLKRSFRAILPRLLMVIVGLLLTTATMAQQLKISGTVTDQENQPVIGATVMVVGTSNGTLTDIDGKYSIDANKGQMLEVRYVGYQNAMITVGDQTIVNIQLEASSLEADQVVVVGYGTTKKSNLSGAVTSVSGKDLRKLPAADLTQALQGNVSGLHTMQTDRNPGSGVNITIRGNNSFSGGAPLYVIDGVPVASGGGVSAVNPNDIESVSVLKDASSTAIYGARAANGVILVTTKSGKIGKTQITVDLYSGIKILDSNIKMMDAQQFAQLRRESYQMDGIEMPNNAFLPTELDMLSSGRSTNWLNETTGQGRMITNAQVSVGSGNDKTKVYFGAGFFNEQGVVNNSAYTRGSIRFNAIQKIGKKVTLSSLNNISLSNTSGANSTSVLFPSLVGNPMSPITDDKGQYYPMIQNALGTPRSNPVAFSDLQKNSSLDLVVTPSLVLDIDIIDGLKFKTQLSGEIDLWKGKFYNPKLISGLDENNGRVSDGYARLTNQANFNWITESLLSYNKTFGKHGIEALVGFSYQANQWESVTASASGFADDLYGWDNLGVGSGAAIKPSSGLINWAMISYIGRAIYTYNDKLIFTANMRIDGSSRFGNNNKYGYFPSGAAAWKMKEEPWLKDVEWLSELKLRASYGLSGNANAISPYQTLARLAYANYNFNDNEVPGYYEENMPSPNLKWETTEQLDFGIDLSVLDRRLELSLDYYYKKTRDLIRTIDIPSVSGFPSTWANMGDMSNEGLEVTINSRNFVGEFVWNTGFNISFNKNTLLSLGDGSDRIGTSHWVGQPIGIGNRYMIKAIGIWQTEQAAEAAKYGFVPGDVRYEDTNSDDKIDDKDRQFCGSYYPKFFGSLNNYFEYKGFDLNVFMTFEYGRDIYNGNNYLLLSGASADNNRVEMLDRWTAANPSNKYPRASATGNNRLSTTTSEFLEDGSYFKIKNISFGYTLPKSALEKMKMSNFRVYASVTNPLTLTNYTGLDPEDGDIFNNSRSAFYPRAVTWTLGLQLGF